MDPAAVPENLDDSLELLELGQVFSVVGDVVTVQGSTSSVVAPNTIVTLPTRQPIGLVRSQAQKSFVVTALSM
jgi:hypothetical protein